MKAIVAAEVISSQTELVEKLRGAGLRATQASVSRDLNELGIAKHDGRYSIPDLKPEIPAIRGSEFLPVGDNLIVGRCSPGLASAIAVRIDAEGLDEIVGTIAGDDTIFVAVDGPDAQASAIISFGEMFG